MEDGLTGMVRKGPRLWVDIQWRQHPCDSASPWQLLSAGLKSEWRAALARLITEPRRLCSLLIPLAPPSELRTNRVDAPPAKIKREKTTFPISAERGRLPDTVCKDRGPWLLRGPWGKRALA